MSNIERHIDVIEGKIKNKLPEYYKNFLLKEKLNINNILFKTGTSLDDIVYEDSTNENEDIIDYLGVSSLYGYDNEKHYDLLESNFSDFLKRIPESFITIGEDLVGDQICLGLSGEYINKVYLWEMELEADENRPQPYYDINNQYI